MPATEVAALRQQLDALRLLLQADGVEDSASDVALLVKELDAIGIQLRGGSGDSVADIAVLVSDLQELAGRYPAQADVELARVRVNDSLGGRIAAWRETAPSLDLTSQRAPG